MRNIKEKIYSFIARYKTIKEMIFAFCGHVSKLFPTILLGGNLLCKTQKTQQRKSYVFSSRFF